MGLGLLTDGLAPATARLGLVLVTDGLTARIVIGRDWHVWDNIRTLLNATGVFAMVIIGAVPEVRSRGVDRSPIAIIKPDSWEEIDHVDPIQMDRTVRYRLVLIVRHEDPEERVRQLDRLEAVCHNALDGQEFNNQTLYGYSKLRSGSYEEPRHPEQRMVIRGEFVSVTEGYDGHDTLLS